MTDFLWLISWFCLLPVLGGTAYSLLTLWTTLRFLSRPLLQASGYPGVSVLKPVRGLEKNLARNLRSMAEQDYPTFQVIYSVQDPQDAALPLLQELAAEFGSERVMVVVALVQAGANGKVNNLLGGLPQARYDYLVINDSDTLVPPDYLRTIVAPLLDSQVGCVTTPFKLVQPRHWYEALELLTINADFIPSVIFAEVTGASKACLGPSIAIRRQTLEEVGGLEELADYLVEDFELGRRVWTSGQKMVLLPYFIDAVVDLDGWRDWWTHQVYWDQNTYLASPLGFIATILIRAVPFAVLFCLLQGTSLLGLATLFATLGVRYLTVGIVARWLKDKAGLKALWWLPLRDCAGVIFWGLAFTQRTVTWQGLDFKLTARGKMEPLG